MGKHLEKDILPRAALLVPYRSTRLAAHEGGIFKTITTMPKARGLTFLLLPDIYQ